MTENPAPLPASEPAGVSRPQFLTDYAPTRFRRRWTPFSRIPATARLGEVWQVAAQRAGTQRVIVDRPADIDPTGPVDRDYAGWAALVEQAAGWLHAAGVRPWDRVAILKANHLDVTLLASAVARLGAVPATLGWTHTPEFVHAMLARLEKPFLVTDNAQLWQCGMDAEAVAELTTRTITVDRTTRQDVTALDDLRGAPAVPPNLRADDEPMVITHTSGTTGIPKLVMHSANSIHSLALVEAERWPIFRMRPQDTLAYCDPYFHQRMATAMAAIATVTPTVLMLSEPQAPTVKRLLLAHKPTIVETLPNIYLHWEELARDPQRPFGDVRVFVNSFDAIHTRTIRTFLHATDRRLPIWVQSWSQTEAGAIVIRPYLRSSVRRVGKRPPPTQVLGWPIPFLCKIRAVDPDTGRRVPRGQVGLIEVSQPGRSLAYVGEQHRHDLKRNGWFWNTGDLGVINRFGAVRLVDREIDRIPGASAIELEDVLLDRLPQTTEVVILAVADSKPVPVLSIAGDLPLDRAEWARATADLPELADPIQLQWDDFPRTATWKIRRVQLRERLFAGTSAIGVGRWT
jgi:acyl-coenzyme A synthetase/AMP-(fatty) acid ligase